MCVLDPNLVNFPRLLGGHLHSDSPRQCLMFRPPIIDSTDRGSWCGFGESLVVEVKFQVGKLKTSPAELACCQDLKAQSFFPALVQSEWSQTNAVHDYISSCDPGCGCYGCCGNLERFV